MEHTFWVEVVDTGEPVVDCNKLLVNIYQDETKDERFQTFESWWADPYGLYCFPVADMTETWIFPSAIKSIARSTGVPIIFGMRSRNGLWQTPMG